MAAIVNENHYRVSYKFPKMPVVNMNYTSPSLAALMRNLQQTENVFANTVEFLVVHQILPNGKIAELVDIEHGGNQKIINRTNVVPFKVQSKELTVLGLQDRDEDDELLGWVGDRGPQDERVLDRVTALLTKASTSEASKPRIILRAVAPKTRKVIKGFHFTAKPAHCEATEN